MALPIRNAAADQPNDRRVASRHAAARLAVVIGTLGRFWSYHTARVLQEQNALEALLVGYSRPPPEAIRPFVRRYPLARSLLAHAAVRCGWAAIERWTFRSFDRWVCGQLRGWPRPIDVFHGYSLFSLEALRSARCLGMVTVVERAGVHILDQVALVQQAHERHGVPFQLRSTAYYASVDRMLAEYDAAGYVLTCSEFARQTFLARGHDPARVISIPFGATYAYGAVESVRQPPSRFVVLCIGGEFFRKGIPDLLEAWSALSLPAAELRLLTSVPTDLPPRLRALLGQATVRLLPRMDAAALAREYRASSVLCLPSVEDGFGLVVMEAMAHGVPAIVSTNCGAAEAVRHGVDGFVVPAGDSRALAEHILALYRDRELVEHMAWHVQERAAEFTWERYGRRLVEFYKRILATEVLERDDT